MGKWPLNSSAGNKSGKIVFRGAVARLWGVVFALGRRWRVLPQLSAEAWALLGFLHHAEHGGSPPPRISLFEKAYSELLTLDLAERDRDHIKITPQGEAALLERLKST
jgi:hypothetical protein